MTSKDREEHNAVVTDAELEAGEHPIGEIVHISTVTHAWRGRLRAVTASYYILAADGDPLALVDQTGNIGDYAKTMAAGSAEDVIPKGSKRLVRIPRGAVAWILS